MISSLIESYKNYFFNICILDILLISFFSVFFSKSIENYGFFLNIESVAQHQNYYSINLPVSKNFNHMKKTFFKIWELFWKISLDIACLLIRYTIEHYTYVANLIVVFTDILVNFWLRLHLFYMENSHIKFVFFIICQ